MSAKMNIVLSIPNDIKQGRKVAELLGVPEGTYILDDDFTLDKGVDGKWSAEYHACREIPDTVAKAIIEELA